MQDFLKILDEIKIVHHIRGRIRLKISQKGILQFIKLNSNSGLKLQISDFKGIKDYRISKAALSCIINYDANIIDFADWQEVFNNDYQKSLRILAKYKS